MVVAAFHEAAPYVRSLSTYSAAPGTLITVTGANFTGATQVLVGGVPVAFTVLNATTIVLTVPPVALTSGGMVTVVGPRGVGGGGYFYTAVPTGLSGGVAATPLALWPNPAADVMYLSLATPADVMILDGVGRVVWRVAGSHGTLTLPVADLTPGTYTVRAGARVARLVRQ
ncbi:MAG: IPT/TIG domain-containing protein [Hymenobacteraceae bacterium]|nr:IPT/TIG domain-containing protein [Hymenobacteraceae bacterium]